MALHPLLGRRVEFDERSRRFPAPGALPVTTRTWRRYGHVLNQNTQGPGRGPLGSCTGNAMAHAVNTKPLHKVGRVLRDGDAVRLYSAATRGDPFPGAWPPDDTGSSTLAAAKAARDAGYLTGYRWCFGLPHVLSALMSGPVLLGTNWYEAMMVTDRSGAVHPAGEVLGGHAYLALGVNTKTRRVLCLNSWGRDWGRVGGFDLTFDDLGRLLGERGEAAQVEHVPA